MPSLKAMLDADGTNGWRAEECLRWLAELPVDDLAVPSLVAAAQTFALLAVADALTDPNRGYTLAQTINNAHGVQP